MFGKVPRSLLASGFVIVVLLVACSRSAGVPAAAGGGGGQDLAATVRELGQCIRAHGLPNFPDPTVGSDGQVHIPASAPRLPAAAQRACQSIIDRLPNTGPTTGPPVSHAVFQQWLAFAACMRAHGLPDFPDPNPDGSFSLPPDIVHLPNGAIRPQIEACRTLSPTGLGKFQGEEQ